MWLPCLQVLLSPGDVLFIPAFWFHNVLALRPEGPGVEAAGVGDADATEQAWSASGGLGVSINLFWRTPDESLFQARDLYGNRDLLAGVNCGQPSV